MTGGVRHRGQALGRLFDPVAVAHARRRTGLALAMALLACRPVPSHAERLPSRTYTIADGLASDRVERIMRDSRGFLWLCTDQGLSRYDGERFVSYGTRHGLPNPRVRYLLETRSGDYWIATSGGVCRFYPDRAWSPEQPLFEAVPGALGKTPASCLAEDGAGVVWCGTGEGLYRVIDGGTPEIVKLGDGPPPVVWSLMMDRAGSLWIGTRSGLMRLTRGGKITRYDETDGLTDSQVLSLLQDSRGRIWVGGRVNGISRFDPPQDSDLIGPVRTFGSAEGLRPPVSWNNSICESRDGTIWAGRGQELAVYDPVRDRFRQINDARVVTIGQDLAGDLWLGTESRGALRLWSRGLTTWDHSDGLETDRIAQVLESSTGDLGVISGGLTLSLFDGRRFHSLKLTTPPQVNILSWGWGQLVLQCRNGEWWVPTAQGVCRYAPAPGIADLAGRPPIALYTTRDGLPQIEVFRIFEDSRGDVWMATLGTDVQALVRWRRSSGRLEVIDSPEAARTSAALWFAEDSAGSVWVGLYRGGCLRINGERAELLSIPGGPVSSLHPDSRGWMWIGTEQAGLACTKDPLATQPHFFTRTTADGLASDQITCIVEDRWGRIYAGTGRGVERIDPETDRIEHFTSAQGLAANSVTVAHADRHGRLWFGTLSGLSVLTPTNEPEPSPPPIFLSTLSIAGASIALPEAGVSSVGPLTVPSHQARFQIGYFGIGFGTGGALRYQYRVGGMGNEWSAPDPLRGVTLHLPPGRHRFEVRALAGSGAASSSPATLSLIVLRPIWQRWWFIATVLICSAAAAYSAYRYRLGRMVELERIRTRIAADLHDDIGAGLSEVALLGELVRRELGDSHPAALKRLDSIAGRARELVDTMSDIVWSIDPRRDDVRSVVVRIRQYAADVFDAAGVAWEFEAAEEVEVLRLRPEQRRHLFLIFKEAVTNVARHARATQAHLRLRVAAGRFVGEVSDNGRGLERPAGTPTTRGGHGLGNMKARAGELGGELRVEPAADGSGLCVRLEVPLKARFRRGR